MGATFTGSIPAVCGGVVFTALLGWASVSDLRTRRIPNRLVLVLGIGGLLFTPLVHDGGFMRALSGLLLGFAVWIPLYALGALGAGDVKLFAAAAAWLGPRGALDAALLAAVAGGVLAFLLAVHASVMTESGRSRLVRLVRMPHDAAPDAAAPARTSLPYGVALAAGALLAGWFPPFVW